MDPNNPRAATHLKTVMKGIRAQREAINTKNASQKNNSDRPAMREAQNAPKGYVERGQNRTQLAHMDSISRQYITDIMTKDILIQLSTVQGIIWKLKFNNNYIGKTVSVKKGSTTHEFTKDDIPDLEQLVESLRNALYIMTHPTYEFPKLHNFSKQLVFNQEKYDRFSIFFISIIGRVIPSLLKAIENQKKLLAKKDSNYNVFHSTKQKQINYDKKIIDKLPNIIQLLEDTLYMLPQLST